jgi:hypothetical protein
VDARAGARPGRAALGIGSRLCPERTALHCWVFQVPGCRTLATERYRVTSPRKRRVSCTAVSHSEPAQLAARRGVARQRARRAAPGAGAQAHATAHNVALFYAAPDATRAAYLKDWDAWRGAGVRFEACYSRPDAAGADVLAANGAVDPNPGAVLVCARPATGVGSQPICS